MCTQADCDATYIVDEQSAVIAAPLLGHQIDVQTDRFSTVSVDHAARRSVVPGVDGAVEAVVECYADVHVPGFARGGDLGDEVAVDELTPYLEKLRNVIFGVASWV